MCHLLLDRRQALISIGLAAFHGAAWSLPKPLQPTLWEETSPDHDTSESLAEDTIDDRLRADLARRAARVDSEEGVPMFLACVNMVAAPSSHQVPKATLTPLSAGLALTFRRNAETYQRIKPDAGAKDMAPLIEILADRDFMRGETTETS